MQASVRKTRAKLSMLRWNAAISSCALRVYGRNGVVVDELPKTWAATATERQPASGGSKGSTRHVSNADRPTAEPRFRWNRMPIASQKAFCLTDISMQSPRIGIAVGEAG